MNSRDKIYKYLDDITNYYYEKIENNNTLSFLKKEVKCIDEGLDLIDLNVLPISENDIQNYRLKQRENLKENNYLEKSKELNIQLTTAIFKSGLYSAMSKLERAVYDALNCLFPIEIETQDLLIEHFIWAITTDYKVDEEKTLELLIKYFNEVLDSPNYT